MESTLQQRFQKLEFTPYLVLGLTLLILLLFIAYPLSKVILNSFLEMGDAPSLENLTLTNFSQFFTSALYKSAFVNTLMVGFLCVLFSCMLGIPMAYFVARTEVPFKAVFLTLGTLPLILPPFVGAYSWILLFGREGVVNYFLDQIFGFVLPDIYGAPGIVIAMTMSYYPFVFLLTYGSLLSADPYIEESAAIMGGIQMADDPYGYSAVGDTFYCGQRTDYIHAGCWKLWGACNFGRKFLCAPYFDPLSGRRFL